MRLRALLAIFIVAGSASAQDLIGGSSGGATGGGAPTDATYWLGSANGSLSAEIVVNDIASLEAAISAYDFNDAANLTTGDIAAARMETNLPTALGSAFSNNGCVPFKNGSVFDCYIPNDGDLATAGVSLSGGDVTIEYGNQNSNTLIIGNETTASQIRIARDNLAASTYGGALTSGVAGTSLKISAYGKTSGSGGTPSLYLSGGSHSGAGNTAGSVYIAAGYNTTTPANNGTVKIQTASATPATLFEIGGSQTTLCQDQTATTGDTQCVVKGGAGEAGNAFEVQNSSGVVNAAITAAGALTAATVAIADNTTPSASTDACAAETIWGDGTYLYYCIASGNIGRVAWTTGW